MEKNERIQKDSETKKNAVVAIAIGKSKKWEICKRSLLKYCEKYDLPLEVITQPKYGIKPFDMYANLVNLFEKNQVYDLFEKYDRILRLDWDIIIAPNCPNLFEIVPEDKIGGVFEDVGPEKLERRARMKDMQDQLGNINWTSGYLNSGVIVASKHHKEIFNTSMEEINVVQKLKNIVCPEQDYFNYVVRKLGFEIYNLNYHFNHMTIFSGSWNGSLPWIPNG
jgi:hypothetical protein